MTASMLLDISDNYMIIGEVTDIETEIMDFKTYFFSHDTKESLEART